MLLARDEDVLSKRRRGNDLETDRHTRCRTRCGGGRGDRSRPGRRASSRGASMKRESVACPDGCGERATARNHDPTSMNNEKPSQLVVIFSHADIRCVSTMPGRRIRALDDIAVGPGRHYDKFRFSPQGIKRRRMYGLTRRGECPRPRGINIVDHNKARRSWKPNYKRRRAPRQNGTHPGRRRSAASSETPSS